MSICHPTSIKLCMKKWIKKDLMKASSGLSCVTLKRPNSKSPAYKQLVDEQYKVFTPLKWRLRISKDGKRIREKVPFIQDLLFVYGKKVRSIKLYNGFLRFSFDFERVDIVFRWLSAMQKWKSLCMQ